MKCLRSLPVETIANYDVKREVSIEFFADPLAAFGPVVEPENGQDAFLPQSPYEVLAAGNVCAVPLLTGLIDAEGAYIWAAPLLFLQCELPIKSRNILQTNFTGIAPIAFYFKDRSPPERKQEVADKIQKFYFQDEGFDLNHQTDRFFAVSHTRFANLYSKHAPTYPYTYREFPGFESAINQTIHDEYNLDLLFDKPIPNAKDKEFESLSKSVVKLLVSFISEGKPTATYGSEKTFPKLDSEQGLQQFYRIDKDTSLVLNLFSESIKFWEGLNFSDNDFSNPNPEIGHSKRGGR